MEQFIDIAGYGGLYQVGEFGRVRSYKGKRVRYLKPGKQANGYLKIVLSKKSNTRTFLLHRLVAIHHIPNPENLPEVNHLDGNKLNCAKSNLAWTTEAGNKQHAVETGLRNDRGQNNPAAKLTDVDVLEIRRLKGLKTRREIKETYNLSVAYISALQNKKVWKHL